MFKNLTVSATSTAIVLVALAAWGEKPAVVEATASNLEAQELIEQTIDALCSAIDSSDAGQIPDLLNEVITRHVDLESISRHVLGSYWRDANRVQQQQFVNEFRRLLVRTYTLVVAEFSESQIEHVSSIADEGKHRTFVRARATRPIGLPVTFAFRLQRHKGPWKIYDVLVEGVSSIAIYRRSFRAQARKVGIDSLIERLAARNQ